MKQLEMKDEFTLTHMLILTFILWLITRLVIWPISLWDEWIYTTQLKVSDEYCKQVQYGITKMWWVTDEVNMKKCFYGLFIK